MTQPCLIFSYPCHLLNGSKIHEIYGTDIINERHRHRFNVNIKYLDIFEKHGLIASGYSQDKEIIEILEYNSHPWFVGIQFHPEFKSRLLNPHPLFISFIQAALKHNGSL